MHYQDNLADYIESAFFIYRKHISDTVDLQTCKSEFDRIQASSIRIDPLVNKSSLRKRVLNRIRHNQELCGYESVYCTKEYKESLSDFNYVENELVHGFVRGILHKGIESGKQPKFPGLHKATIPFYLYYTKEVIWYCSQSKSSVKEQLAEDLKSLVSSYIQQQQGI
jgi:hypothetical protein